MGKTYCRFMWIKSKVSMRHRWPYTLGIKDNLIDAGHPWYHTYNSLCLSYIPNVKSFLLVVAEFKLTTNNYLHERTYRHTDKGKPNDPEAY